MTTKAAPSLYEQLKQRRKMTTTTTNTRQKVQQLASWEKNAMNEEGIRKARKEQLRRLALSKKQAGAHACGLCHAWTR